MIKKSRKVLIALAAVIAASFAGLFLWPHSAEQIAWGYKEAPAVVQIMRYGVGEDASSVFVALPQGDIAPFMEQLRGTTVQFSSPAVKRTWRTAMYSIYIASSQAAADTIIDEEGNFVPQQETNAWPKQGTYRFSDAMEGAALLQTCRNYADPEGGFPGLAFLLEFFSIGKDGRAEMVDLKYPDGSFEVAANDWMQPYAGIQPFLTEHGFAEVFANRYLYRLEYRCKKKGVSWYCSSISIEPGSEAGYYNFRARLAENSGTFEETPNLSVYGSYAIDEDGLVDSFWMELP